MNRGSLQEGLGPHEKQRRSEIALTTASRLPQPRGGKPPSYRGMRGFDSPVRLSSCGILNHMSHAPVAQEEERLHGKEQAIGSTPVGGSPSSHAVGNVSEAVLLARFVRAGYQVLVPFGEGHRYDLVVDRDGALQRVQVKTGRLLATGVIKFAACSSHYHRGGTSSDYRGDVVLFAVYCPALDRCYLVPVDEVGTSHAYLRVDPVRNGQAAGVRYAADYEF